MSPSWDTLPLIVLFDGECGLCNATVQWLMACDPDGALAFAPLQGTTAELMRASGLAIPTDVSTVVLFERGEVYVRSKAVLRMCRSLKTPFRHLSKLLFLPSALLDVGYRIVAWLRYPIFGRKSFCSLPSGKHIFLS